jgi:cyclomaltodextrinase
MLNDRRGQLPVPTQLAMWNLTDSHDTDRLAQMIVNRNTTGEYKNAEKFDYDEPGNSARQNDQYQIRKPNEDERAIQRLVTLFQLTYVGAPMFYYGVETGIWGGDDPDCRKPMPWPDLAMDMEQTDPIGRARTPDDPNFDPQMHGFFTGVIALHTDNPAFKTADFEVLAAQDEKNVFVYSRGSGDERRVVALNRSGEAQTVTFDGSGAEVIFVSRGDQADIKLASEGQKLELTLPPLTGAVLK